MNKVRFELGLREWAELGKLVKSNQKGILEKDQTGRRRKTTMCQACAEHVTCMTFFKTHRNSHYAHFTNGGTRFREARP